MIVLAIAAWGLPVAGAPPAKPAPARPWWTHAVIYEVYPRSFADSNDDGIGDLPGLIAHLPYLHWLGVNAIWLTPCYPSGGVDGGYDIINYRAIDPAYGSLADFQRLVRAAGREHIRVLMDLVLAHTSDRDLWFLRSRRSRHSPYRNFYIWRSGRAGGPPNNWTSLFGGPAWSYDRRTRQYYYHFYYPQQPDLNWRNPAVKRAMFGNARFWLRRGAAGFRLDSVGTLLVDPRFRDNPPGLIHTGDFPLPQQRHVYNYNRPAIHRILRELRQAVDPYHAVLIGETVGTTEAQLAQFYGRRHRQLQLPFDFLFADVNRLSAPAFRARIAAWNGNPAHGTPDWFFDNHDQPRDINRYGDGRHNPQIARLLATLLLTLRGTAILYYGQEIGMTTTPPRRKQDVVDPMGRRFWPKFKGRDGERTPMQWTPGHYAGFSRHRPWLPIPASARQVNVARERAHPGSLLNYYRRLIYLKCTEPALRRGAWQAVNRKDRNVLSYLRSGGGERVLVMLNMSGQPRTEHYRITARRARILADSLNREPASIVLSRVRLAAFEAVVARVQK